MPLFRCLCRHGRDGWYYAQLYVHGWFGGGADASDNSEMAKRRAELKIAIANATSLDEVTKLEEELLALQSG